MQLVKLVGYGATILSLAVSSGVAYGSDASVEGPTGPDSNNIAEVNETNKLYLDVDNDFFADFDFDDIDVDTGNNNVYDNTTAGDNISGDATVDIALDVNLEQNSGWSCDCLFGDNGDNSASVLGPTGPDSLNEAVVNEYNKAKIDVENVADIDVEDVDVDIDTGDLDSYHNTTVGNTESGSATFNFTANYTVVQN